MREADVESSEQRLYEFPLSYFQTNYNFAVSLNEAHVYKANKLGLSDTT